MPAVPKRLALSEVPAYLLKRYGITRSRQTIYNWATKGKKGRKLRTFSKVGMLYTTENWVNEFISNL